MPDTRNTYKSWRAIVIRPTVKKVPSTKHRFAATSPPDVLQNYFLNFLGHPNPIKCRCALEGLSIGANEKYFSYLPAIAIRCDSKMIAHLTYESRRPTSWRGSRNGRFRRLLASTLNVSIYECSQQSHSGGSRKTLCGNNCWKEEALELGLRAGMSLKKSIIFDHSTSKVCRLDRALHSACLLTNCRSHVSSCDVGMGIFQKSLS